MFQPHPHFAIPLTMLFTGGTAHSAAGSFFRSGPAYQPRIPRFDPQRATERVTPPAPQASPKPSRKNVTKTPAPAPGQARVTGKAKKCSTRGCDHMVGPRGGYCPKCRKRAQRARDKKNGVTR